MWSCSASMSVKRLGAGPIGSSVTSAATSRRRKSASVRRCVSASVTSPSPPTTKSTSVFSGSRRSTVSAVIRAPVIIANAKKRAPMMSQSA
jgi:hypothetical protein